MKVNYILLIIFSVLNLSTKSQLLDSIENSFTYKPKLLLKLDARNSFISDNNVKYGGLKIGLNYNRTTKIGIGLSWINSNYISKYNEEDVKLENINFLAFIEYTFYKSKHWYADIPVQLGFGELKYTKNNKIKANTFIFTYEPAMTLEYRFLKYFGLGFGFGYKFAVYSKQDITEKLSAPIYILRFKLHLGESIRKNKKK
jgi:hypothetical protein